MRADALRRGRRPRLQRLHTELARHADPVGVVVNVLVRLSREFDADFRVEDFVHEAPWIEAPQRIEMRLVSRQPQSVRVAAEECILTECCHKFTPPRIAALAAEAGWTIRRTWSDPALLFDVHYLEPRP
jgi:uncharacterized SAM-dependent methyltransferase